MLKHNPGMESCENSDACEKTLRNQDKSLKISVSSEHGIVLGMCFALLPWVVQRNEFISAVVVQMLLCKSMVFFFAICGLSL